MGEPTRRWRLYAAMSLLVAGACSAADSAVEVGRQPTQAPKVAAAGCSRLDGREAAAAAGLRSMGTAGPHTLYGERGRLLCSEPAAGGEGECELVAPTTVKITRGGETWGYRVKGDSVLRYGPAAVTCGPASAIRATHSQPTAVISADGPAVRPAERFYGSWIVSRVPGDPPPPGQSPILLQIDSGRLFARADCAHLGQLSYVSEGPTLKVGAPPRRPVASCARGLSHHERAFSGVFQPRARARLVGDALVIEGPAGEVRATRTLSSPEITLPLLPPSPLGDAAVLFGVLEVHGPCLYVRAAKTGDRVLPALMQPAARDPATGVFYFGRAALVPGSEVRLGGSMRRGSAPLGWAQAPDPSCDQSRIWVTVSMEESPAPL